jgi:hypothetical protein
MHPKTALILASGIFIAASAFGQQVTLPLPRLLTVMPMGGQAGTNVEVTIAGENIEDVTELTFSSPKITAKPVAERRTSSRSASQPMHQWVCMMRE